MLGRLLPSLFLGLVLPAHAQAPAAPAPVPAAGSPAAVPAVISMAVPQKGPRKFLIDGHLRPLRPGEIRPYVAPTLEPEPTPDPSEIKGVQVDEDEAQVLARPFYGSPMVGTVALGARLPVRGTFLAKSARYCANRHWIALSPLGWICSKQVRSTDEPLTTGSVLHVPEGERLPFHYFMVSSKEPMSLWTSVEDVKNGAEPERMLERGDSIAVQKVWKYDGENYYVSAEGKVLPIKGTYAMGPASEWVGTEIDPQMHVPFGWIMPEKAKLFDSPGVPHKGTDLLRQRTRVDILEEAEAGKKRYLHIRLAGAVPVPVPAVGKAPTPSAAPNPPPAKTPAPPAVPALASPVAPPPSPAPVPAASEEASFWMLASEVNEVRRKPIVEGANPVGQWIDIDLGEQVLVAYEGDRPVYATLVSSGRSIPTPMGNYPLWAKASSITMKSQPYDDKAYFVNKVPWVLFFQAHNAIHGAYWHDRFGVSKSHGCANVSPLDARHLFEWMKPALPPGWSSIRPVDLHESVTVHVYNSLLKKPFRQERPIGPPDRDDEAERMELAEKRRSEAAAVIPAATPPAVPEAAPLAVPPLTPPAH